MDRDNWHIMRVIEPGDSRARPRGRRFPPEPVALRRRAETALLERMADGLALAAAGALEQDDHDQQRV
jgi:hypothetical protein